MNSLRNPNSAIDSSSPHPLGCLRQPVSFRSARIPRSIKGSALVITLLFVLIITILILTFASQVMIERQVAPLHLRSWEAQQMALMGADHVRQTIQQTLAPLDDPFGTTNGPDFFWALAPGRLDLFEFAATGSPARPRLRESIPLHSGTGTNSVDLNAKNSEGKQPIWQNGPPMPVTWVNVLKNPGDTNASATNPIVGRFAFWVDDDGSKINVNTADGTYNYQIESYGQGTPSAVSPSVFREAGEMNAPDTNASRLIAQAGRDIPYASLADIGSRPGQNSWAEFFATNNFNFTTYSRAPDFNIFNEPKFQLFPSWTPAVSGVPVPRNLMIQWVNPGTGGSPFSNNSNLFTVRSVYPTTNQFTDAARRALDAFMPSYYFTDYNIYGYSISADYVGQMITSDAKRTNAGGTFVHNEQRLFQAMTRMAGYLIGRDSFDNPITWPFQDPAYYLTNSPAAGKYTLRQIDSITLQTFELVKQVSYGKGSDWRPTSIAPYGILNPDPDDLDLPGQPVSGIHGRSPHLVQVLAGFNFFRGQPGVLSPASSTNLDYGNLKGYIRTQSYIPKNLYQPDWKVNGQAADPGNVDLSFASAPFGSGSVNYAAPSFSYTHVIGTNSASFGGANSGGYNLDDWPSGNTGRGSMLDFHKESNSTQWSRWADRLLSVKTGDPAGYPHSESGVDLAGQFRANVDNDYRAADLFQPAADGRIYGRQPNPGITVNPDGSMASYGTRNRSFFTLRGAQASGGMGSEVPVGAFHTIATTLYADPFLTRNLGNRIDQLVIEGGLTYRMFERSIIEKLSELVPLDAIAMPFRGNNNNLNALPRIGPVPDYDPRASIPLHPPGQPIEVKVNTPRYVVTRVRDPLLNQLPGDWVPRVYTSQPNTNQTRIAAFTGFASASVPGNDGGARSPFNANHESEWVDMASMSGTVVQRETTNWYNTSPQQTFPSVGRLQYIRTGAMPDNPNAAPGDLDYAGMPFRCLNFGPPDTQGSIPDWAMLDLFTVPNAVWTKPASRMAYVGTGQVPRLINLTYGGASSGKINLNGSVLFPWATTNATQYTRAMPLAAQFSGLRYNTDGVVKTKLVNANESDYPAPGVTVTVSPFLRTDPSSWQVLDADEAIVLAENIAAYIGVHGPLSMPGQMCDIPAVNAYGAAISMIHPQTGDSLLPPGVTRFYGRNIPNPETPVINRTRNDIVSQSVGNLVTQGNVFSVWTVGQVIKKGVTNPTLFGEFEAGDQIQGEVRLRVVIERQLDLGVDGVPGNSANPGPDGAVGSMDDPADNSYHPLNPRFVYRILGVYEIP